MFVLCPTPQAEEMENLTSSEGRSIQISSLSNTSNTTMLKYYIQYITSLKTQKYPRQTVVSEECQKYMYSLCRMTLFIVNINT